MSPPPIRGRRRWKRTPRQHERFRVLRCCSGFRVACFRVACGSSIYNPSSSGLYLTFGYPFPIHLPWGCPCAPLLSLSFVRVLPNTPQRGVSRYTSLRFCRSATTSHKFSVTKFGSFLSRLSMFSHSLLSPCFWFIKPSLLSYFLFPELCLFFKNFVSYFSICT